MSDNIYTLLRKIAIPRIFSLDIYAVKSGGVDPKHYHNNFEIVYIIKGNSKTYKEHHVYIYPKGKIHEMKNNSKNDLIIACLTIPPESEENTVFV